MKYFVSIDNQVSGPHDLNELWLLEDFNPQTLVYSEDSQDPNAWQYADSVPELQMVFTSFTKKIAVKSPEAPARQENAGRKLMILAIDDDPLIRTLLWDIMSGEGHTMQFAKDGDEVFQRIAKARFDLIILDVNMPNLNGYKVAEEITSRQSPDARPKILLFTSRNIESEKVQFNISGADAILQKGSGIDTILAKVYELAGVTPKTLQTRSQDPPKATTIKPPLSSQEKTARIDPAKEKPSPVPAPVPAKEKIAPVPPPVPAPPPAPVSAVEQTSVQDAVCKDMMVNDIELMKRDISKNTDDVAAILTGHKDISNKIKAQPDFIGMDFKISEMEKKNSAIRRQMGRLYVFIVIFFSCLVVMSILL